MRSPWLLVLMGMLLFINILPSQDNFPARHGLPVDNYGLEMNWDYFEEAFLGVQPRNPLDTALYKIIAGHSTGGVCFGMSSLVGVVYDEGGYMGMCSPLSMYTPNNTAPGMDTLGAYWPQMKRAIMVLYSRQYSTEVLRIVVEAVSHHYFTDPQIAAEKADYYLSSQEIPVICISESSTPGSFGGMHAIYPYKIVKHSHEWLLYVYDPSFPYFQTKSYYDNDSNYVSINAFIDSWHYDWPTTPVTRFEGFIYTVPARRLLLPTSNPLLLADLASLVTNFFMNKGRIVKVTDNTTGLTLGPDDLFVERNGTAIVRWLPINGENTGGDMLIIQGGNNHNFTFTIKPAKDSLYLVSSSGNHAIELEAESGGETFSLTFNGLGSPHQMVELNSENSSVYARLTLHHVFDRDDINSFKISPIQLGQNEKFAATFDEKGEAVTLMSEYPQDVTVNFIKYSSGESELIETINSLLSDKKYTVFAPISWDRTLFSFLKNR